ncbi:hypothetical protein GCM10010420_29710 [Streptomyces glaucosporus]|uniref:Uncharacterized protein n=1 Tax=Streptomyces glaucosporus TaxID=284044 RepID=A0ABN3ICP8_9ACTN
MTTLITKELIGLETAASCLLGSSSLSGTGVLGVTVARPASRVVLPTRERAEERPTQAPAAAAVAQVDAHAFTDAVNGAENGQKQSQYHTMWAFRGLEPWRDPA